MRVNVYAEELGAEPRTEIVRKEVNGVVFYGIRLYLGFPFIHHEGDDDSSAVTFWVPWTMQGGQQFQKVEDVFLAMGQRLRDAWHEEILRQVEA